jgi:glycosyltransferase involved in cell wall biosynthesis
MSGQSGILNIAYAFDKPVVASDVGGFNELIEDGETGYLVPPKDSNVLAKSIIKILKDETLKKKMEDNVHKKAQEISWANIGKKYIELYMEICRDGD